MTDETFADYWEYLVDKIHRASYQAATADERIFYSANILRGSVPRSGIVGYFENTACDVIRDAHHALSTLGLPDALKHLQDAQQLILNGNPLPETASFVTLFDSSLAKEERDKALDDLDESVRDIEHQLGEQDEAIFDALCRFADEKSLCIRKS